MVHILVKDLPFGSPLARFIVPPKHEYFCSFIERVQGLQTTLNFDKFEIELGCFLMRCI